MPRRTISTLLISTALTLSLPAAGQDAAASPSLPRLREELLAMQVEDQAVRNQAPPDFARWEAVDKRNVLRFKEIVKQYGWPSFAMVGRDGGGAAWLLAQHADRDPDFQRQALAMMAPLVEQDQANPSEYAYLHDRTHTPQRFGTQGSCISKEAWLPFEIEDLPGLAERRRKLGLMTMSDYAALFKDLCAQMYDPRGLPPPDKRTVPVPLS